MSLGVGGDSSTGDWKGVRAPGGASERGYQPGRRQEHERELKTEARERTGASLRGGRNREGTKGRSMGGD